LLLASLAGVLDVELDPMELAPDELAPIAD